MSQPDIYAVLDACLSRLGQGEPPEACLADYPSHAGELAPDLALAAELIQLPRLEPSPEAVTGGYQKLAAAQNAQNWASLLTGLSAFWGRLFAPGRSGRPGLATAALRAVVVGLIVLALAGSLVVTAAADTLPGDALYPVKRSWENVRLSLTQEDSSRQTLQLLYERRRREEVQAVVDLRRPVEVEFQGVLESELAEVWQVDGLTLHVGADTQISGAVAAGQPVTVRAQVKEDGTLDALAVVVDDPRPSPGTTPAPSTEPTPTATSTRSAVTPSPTPSAQATRPKPTATVKPTDRPTRQPTGTTAPSIDLAPTRTPPPTDTPNASNLATPAVRPTETRANVEPTPTRATSDIAPPTPTATSQPKRDEAPTPTPTATRRASTGDQDNLPP